MVAPPTHCQCGTNFWLLEYLYMFSKKLFFSFFFLLQRYMQTLAIHLMRQWNSSLVCPPHLLPKYGNALILVFMTYISPLSVNGYSCPICEACIWGLSTSSGTFLSFIFYIFFSGWVESNTSISRRISTRLGAFLWEGYQDKRWLVRYPPSKCVVPSENCWSFASFI